MRYVTMPGWMVGVVALGSVVAQTAVLLVFQLGQPRILFAMARDGLLPPVFARVHPRFGTPHVSTIGALFAFMLVCVGIAIMRFREPGRARPFRVPFGPLVVPVLGFVSCAFL